MKIFTIGFTQKNAEKFFGLLSQHNIKFLIDIRINPQGQLSGFAKKEDLPFLLENLSNHCQYIYMPTLAPTKEILHKYRENKNWSIYAVDFEELMNERHIPEELDRELFEKGNICFLCSEATPEKCHRRLIAERISKNWDNVEIIHL